MARVHILSVVALCMALLVLPATLSNKYRKGGNEIIDGGGSSEEEGEDGDEVWLFHFGPVDSREEYLNPITGEVNGYHVDVLNAVCEIGEKNCEIVYDQSSHCWDSVDGLGVGGLGVFNFYYDACVGWYPTFARSRTFQFSDSFSQSQGSGFAVPAGNRAGFDPTDLTGQTIGFIRGFFSNPQCIGRQGENITGSALTEDQIVYYNSAPELQAALTARPFEIDAAFDWQSNYGEDNADEYDFLNYDSLIQCAQGGPAFMSRKDNRLNEWMDDAIEELLESEQYQEICAGMEGVHGHKVGPNAADVCIGYIEPSESTTVSDVP